MAKKIKYDNDSIDSRNISWWAKMIAYIIMITFTILAAYPIIWLFLQSFKTNQDYLMNSKLALPSEWFLNNYVMVWTQRGLQFGFPNFLMNSIIYTVTTTVAVVILSNMAAFAIAKIPFKGSKVIYNMFIIGILLVLQSILIPLFLMVHAAGLFNTRIGILIPYIALGLPMGIYLFTDFIRVGIPDELIESAKIDGASYLGIFPKIIFPMCAPVSVTLSIIGFTGTWNEFIMMNILTEGDRFKSIPAMVGRYAGALGSDYGRLFTSLSLAIIPILIFYFALRKQITKGVSAGAVKG